MGRRTVSLLLVLLLSALVGPPIASAAPDAGPPRADVEAGLIDRLEDGDLTRVVVEFGGQRDLAAARAKSEPDARARAVVADLKAAAEADQAGARGLARARGARATSFWLTNVLVVDGADRGLVESLARRPEVTAIRSETMYDRVDPVKTPEEVLEAAAADPEWGVAKIGAPDAWDAGVLGGGVVVANVDTGVDHLHPALVDQYRGNLGGGTFDHDYNWWDPTGICGTTPCDNDGHGTHTMGTIVGGDGPGEFTPDIGVAPGATWIAAKGCEGMLCSETALLSSGQWILAPTTTAGGGADPTKRPDIVNNSWGGGPGDEFYTAIVDAWRSAGIIPVFSAGNSGPECESGGSPGDFLGSYSVGATDLDDLIAEFSSRGPSVFGKVNPDVSAPGVAVNSAMPGGGYQMLSGTSMAAPHVVGALALVLSAAPELVGDVDSATAILSSTAIDRIDTTCGGDDDGDPNNVYGDGRIDAGTAVALVATGGTLAGTVTDAESPGPVGGARVSADDGARTFNATTATDGTYTLFLPAGTYDVTVTAFGYEPHVTPGIAIVTDETTTHDVAMTPLPRYLVTGTVTTAEDGAPLPDATVRALGVPVAPVTTDGNGNYVLELPVGSYTLEARSGGCTAAEQAEVELVDADITQDFQLARKLDRFGHTCAPTTYDWEVGLTESSMSGDEISGRFTLPFTFSHYGEPRTRVWVSDNGYLTFTSPEYSTGWNTSIPSSDDPNDAVYALWQDLAIDDDATVRYGTVGIAPDRAFVVEWDDVRVYGATARADLQVKLWEDGTIDVLYGGDNPAATDGRRATIGLEDADGTDALMFGFRDSVAEPGTAWRYTVAPTGTVTGTVTDLNDGEPIAGATVTASPGDHTAVTAEDGTYSLKLLPGTYAVGASMTPYVAAETTGVTVTTGMDTVVDFALAAPVAVVTPTTLSESVDFAEVATPTLTIENTGSAPLTWELRERDRGVTPIELPPAIAATRDRGWGPSGVDALAPLNGVPPVDIGALDVVLEDPVGDALGSVDVIRVLGGMDDEYLSAAIEFTPETLVGNVAGYLLFDVDQNIETGIPPEWLSGKPSQDIGVDYFADLFEVGSSNPVVVIWDEWFELVAVVPAWISGQTVAFSVPVSAFGEVAGGVDVAGVLGDWFSPTDWVPDVGHGTIEPTRDAPWMEVAPTSGVVPAGESTEVTVTLGGSHVQPGSYEGQLRLVSDAPRQQGLTVDVTLDVALPPTFGGISGTIVDSRTYEPLRADVVVTATWEGSPVAISTSAAPDGTYTVLAPAGTWTVSHNLDGYVTQNLARRFDAGVTRQGLDVELVPIQPQAGLDVSEIDFLVETGTSASAPIILSNNGPIALSFDVGEVDYGLEPPPVMPEPGSVPATVLDPSARTTRGATSVTPLAPPATAAAGDLLAAWWTGLGIPWGVGFSGDVWIGDPDAGIDVAFTPWGEYLSEFETTFAADWAADMAYDPDRSLLWQVNVGGNNGIYGLDPVDGSVQQTITGSPWSDISQRGLAYDPGSDSFWIGGWNEGVVYHVAGPSWPTPGETLGQCAPDDPNISGLAYNPSFQLLWMATNSETDTIWLIDPDTCATITAIGHPDPGFNGAGLELDHQGNLWTVSQWSGDAYLLDSGLPIFSDVEWLAISPTSGTVPAGGTRKVTVTVDTASLAEGSYQAMVVFVTDDPLNRTIGVPVQVTVVDDLPGDDVVSVRASAPIAYESGGDGAFTVTRSETTGPLTVRYGVGGTATPGVDYAALSGSIAFADGQASRVIAVKPIDDDEVEPDETVVLTILPDEDYTLGSRTSATVTIKSDDEPPVEEILRLSGADRFATAAAISQHRFADGAAEAVVLARADVFADAVAGAPLAVARGGPMLLTPTSELHPVTVAELQRVLPAGKWVYLLGGEAALSADVANEIAELGYAVRRLAGPDRYATSVVIAEELGEPDVVLVATGAAFPDALAAGAAAAAVNGAVILTTPESPNAVTDAYLASRPTVARYAIGGPAARAYPSITPLIGADRIATALAVATEFFPAPTAVGVARADQFADALTGSAHIGAVPGPILLTPSDALHPDVSAWVGARQDTLLSAYLYGGTVALADAVMDAVSALFGTS
jgi:subtilisin family serine protease